MTDIGIKSTKNDFQAKLDGMLSRSKMTQGAFARIYTMYQKFQTERFMSEGASEGSSWEALKPDYEKRKLKEFRSYPGAGTKMLIATSTLAGAVIGPGSPFKGIDRHRAQFLTDRMIIRVEETGVNEKGRPFTYPHHVNEKRDFMTFSDKSLKLMKDELSKYIFGF